MCKYIRDITDLKNLVVKICNYRMEFAFKLSDSIIRKSNENSAVVLNIDN